MDSPYQPNPLFKQAHALFHWVLSTGKRAISYLSKLLYFWWRALLSNLAFWSHAKLLWLLQQWAKTAVEVLQHQSGAQHNLCTSHPLAAISVTTSSPARVSLTYSSLSVLFFGWLFWFSVGKLLGTPPSWQYLPVFSIFVLANPGKINQQYFLQIVSAEWGHRPSTSQLQRWVFSWCYSTWAWELNGTEQR